MDEKNIDLRQIGALTFFPLSVSPNTSDDNWLGSYLGAKYFYSVILFHIYIVIFYQMSSNKQVREGLGRLGLGRLG